MRWSAVVSPLRLNARRFTDRAVKVVSVACREATAAGHRTLLPTHLLLGLALVERGPGRMALERVGLDLSQHRDTLSALAASGEPDEPGDGPKIGSEVEGLLAEAETQARALGHNYVGTEHLVLALLAARVGPAADFFRERGVASERVREAVVEVLAGS